MDNQPDGQCLSSTSTPEYLAFRKSYQTLIGTIKAEPNGYCDALFEKGYISPDVRDYIRTIGITTTDKARKIVDTVIDRVELNPSTFHGLLEILRSPFSDDIAAELQHHYETECEHLQQRSVLEADTECNNTLSGEESFHTCM